MPVLPNLPLDTPIPDRYRSKVFRAITPSPYFKAEHTFHEDILPYDVLASAMANVAILPIHAPRAVGREGGDDGGEGGEAGGEGGEAGGEGGEAGGEGGAAGGEGGAAGEEGETPLAVAETTEDQDNGESTTAVVPPTEAGSSSDEH